MRTVPLFWVAVLIFGSFTFTTERVPLASATHDPTDFTINASFFGWNSTNPPQNPTVTEFRGVPFTALVQWVDDTHNFAIYAKATPATGTKSPFQLCTSPCIARSDDVFVQVQTVMFTFTPTIPPDDNTGLGVYEYYCEYHPFSMHGQIRVFKSPDLNKNGKVDINDIADMAFRFDTKAGQTLYLAADDLDNDGDIDINDIAFAAILFDKILVD